MKPSTALNFHRAEVCDAVERHRTVNPRVFGSVVDDLDRVGGDVDLLVDPLPGTTLLDLGGLQVELESLLGVPVDLLTPGDLPPGIRARVLSSAKPL